MDFYRPEKEKEKKRSELLSKFFIYGGLILVFILISFSVYAVRYSNFLKIKKISVSGVQSFSSDELLGNLRSFFIKDSKVAEFLGIDNILAWGNAEKFLKNYPQFESLEIKKNYFSKEIDVEVKEREKFGIWCQQHEGDDNEFCGWFDKNGVIFSEAPVIETEILKRVNDFSGRNIGVGGNVLPDNFTANLLSIFNVLERAGVNTKTIYLKDFVLEEVETASLAGAPKFYFSLKFSPEFSLAAINSLKKSSEWKKLNYIDFRVENRMYYK